MLHLITRELDVVADLTTHFWRVVTVQLKLYPHLPMSSLHEGLAPYAIRPCDTQPCFFFVVGKQWSRS